MTIMEVDCSSIIMQERVVISLYVWHGFLSCPFGGTLQAVCLEAILSNGGERGICVCKAQLSFKPGIIW